MPIFFRNPILSRVEDALWAKAKARYVAEGNDPFVDLAELPKNAKRQISEWKATWESEERPKLDIAIREFKAIVSDKTGDALSRVICNSERDWYSVEVKDSIYPLVLAVPLEVLRYWVKLVLAPVLGEKIQFKDLLPESLEAFASFAGDKYFEGVLHNARKKGVSYEIKKALRPAVIADVVEKDFYHLGIDDEASRPDMVILTSYDRGYTDKSAKKARKAAVKNWKARLKETDGRPDGRRFSGEGWQLPEGFLTDLGRAAV